MNQTKKTRWLLDRNEKENKIQSNQQENKKLQQNHNENVVIPPEMRSQAGARGQRVRKERRKKTTRKQMKMKKCQLDEQLLTKWMQKQTERVRKSQSKTMKKKMHSILC